MPNAGYEFGYAIGQYIAWTVAGVVLGLIPLIAGIAIKKVGLGFATLLLCIAAANIYQWFGLIVALVASLVFIYLVKIGKLKA